MEYYRRTFLKTSLVASLATGGCVQLRPCRDDVACFNFRHIAADDVPDRVEITHTGGDDLPANKVYITNVVTDYESEKEKTVAWSDWDDEVNTNAGIGGKTITVHILFPDVVKILWRHGNKEQVIGETRSFR